MRVKITLIDEGNGHVRIECHPPMPNLLKAWKEGDKNPVLAYAIAGLEKMFAFSREVEAEQQKDFEERAMMNGLVIPDPRMINKQPKLEGPQELDINGTN